MILFFQSIAAELRGGIALLTESPSRISHEATTKGGKYWGGRALSGDMQEFKSKYSKHCAPINR